MNGSTADAQSEQRAVREMRTGDHLAPHLLAPTVSCSLLASPNLPPRRSRPVNHGSASQTPPALRVPLALCSSSPEGDAGLPLWEARIRQLIDADSPDAAIAELLDCLPLTSTDDQLAALDEVIGYYRNNEKRMRYRTFRSLGLSVGLGIVESAHRHVLQVRMKRAGQRWSIVRARRMTRLRAVYRTTGAQRFHRAIRDALKAPAPRRHRPVPNAPRRIKHRYTHPGSPLNRAAASN